MAEEITVVSGTALNSDNSDSILSIKVTNTNAIPCKAATNAYYFVSLTDASQTKTFTFAVAEAGTITALHDETFTVENPSLGTITSSSGIIYYTPAA